MPKMTVKKSMSAAEYERKFGRKKPGPKPGFKRKKAKPGPKKSVTKKAVPKKVVKKAPAKRKTAHKTARAKQMTYSQLEKAIMHGKYDFNELSALKLVLETRIEEAENEPPTLKVGPNEDGGSDVADALQTAGVTEEEPEEGEIEDEQEDDIQLED